MRAAVVLVAALALAGVAVAAVADADLLAVKTRYLPPAQAPFATDPDGLQARYDAARDLEEAVRGVRLVSRRCESLRAALLRFARAQILTAEDADFPVPRTRPRALPTVPAGCTAAPGGAPGAVKTWRLALPPAARVARPEGATDAALAARLGAIGRAYHGWAGFWVHDLATGRTAGWNSDARFAAGSAVKLGALVEAVRRPALAYDAVQIARWSSNLGANRVVERVGLTGVNDALRRLGMWSSTYPGFYRAGTSAAVDAPKPPPPTHTRLTTAHDLGRALYRIHAAALGNPTALAQLRLTRAQAQTTLALLLAWVDVGDNRGLLRPALPAATIAQKNAWISDLRTTAAIVYAATGPAIVVVEVSRPGVPGREARAVAADVVAAVGLDRKTR